MSFAQELKDANAGFKMGADLVDKSKQRDLQRQQLANAQQQVNNEGALIPAKVALDQANTAYLQTYGAYLKNQGQQVDPATQAGNDAAQKYQTAVPDTTVPDPVQVDPSGSNAVPKYAAGGLVDDPTQAQAISMPRPPRPQQPARPSYRDAPLPVDTPTVGDGTSVAPADYPVNDQAYDPRQGQVSGGYNMGVGAPSAQATPTTVDHSHPQNIAQRAIAGGLDYIQHAFGLNQPDATSAATPTPAAIPAAPDTQTPSAPSTPAPAAVPTAPVNPNHGVMMLAQHAGSMSNDEWTQVGKIVDPNGDLDEGLGTIARLNGLYNYYMAHGDLQKANQSSASVIMTANRLSSQLGAAAEEALKKGNVPGAAQLLKKAFGYIPNGYDVDVHGNTVVMKDPNGNVVHQQTFTPQQLFDVATGMKSGKIFWGQMIQQAAKGTGMKPEALGAAPEPLDPAVQQIIGGGATGDAATTPSPDGAASTGGGTPAPGAPQAASPAPQAVPVAPVPGAAPAPPQAAQTPTPGADLSGAGAVPKSTSAIPDATPPDQYAALSNVPQDQLYTPGGDLIPNSPTPNYPISPDKLNEAAQALGQYAPGSPEFKALNAFIQRGRQVDKTYEEQFNQQNPAFQRRQQMTKDTFKPGKLSVEGDDNTQEAISAAITDSVAKLPHPDTGTPVGNNPDDVAKVVGEGTMNNLSALAGSLRVNNPSNSMLANPKRAAQTALNLAYNPSDPLTPNFKPVGRAYGGEGVAIQTNDNPPQILILPNQDYITLVKATLAMHAKFAPGKELSDQAQEGQKGKNQVLSGIAGVAKGLGAQMLSKPQQDLWHQIVGVAATVMQPGKNMDTSDVGNRGSANSDKKSPFQRMLGAAGSLFNNAPQSAIPNVPPSLTPGIPGDQGHPVGTNTVSTPAPASAIPVPNVPNFQMPFYGQ